MTPIFDKLNLMDKLDLSIKLHQLGSSLYALLTEQDHQDKADLWTAYSSTPLSFHLGLALDMLLQEGLYQEIILCGLGAEDVRISKAELEPARDLIDSFCILFATKNGQLNQQQAYQLLQAKTFYFLEKDIEGEISYQTRQEIRGQEVYQTLSCFLTYEKAAEVAKDGYEVSSLKLHQILRLSQLPVWLEPQRRYGLQISSPFPNC